MQTEKVSFDRVCRWSATVLRADTSLTAFQGSLRYQDLPLLPGSLNSALFQLNSHFAVVSLKFVLLLLHQLQDLSFLSRCHKYMLKYFLPFFRDTNMQSQDLSAISNHLHCWNGHRLKKNVCFSSQWHSSRIKSYELYGGFFKWIKVLWLHNHSLKSHLRHTEEKKSITESKIFGFFYFDTKSKQQSHSEASNLLTTLLFKC